MPRLAFDPGRLAATIPILLILPAAPIAQLTTGSGWAVLTAFAALPVVVALAGPRAWPGLGLLRGLLLTALAVGALLGPGLIALGIAFFSLCSSDNGHEYLTATGATLTLAGFALPYFLGSAWAMADTRRAIWAWPLTIVASFAIGIAVMALAEGGPHHCYT